MPKRRLVPAEIGEETSVWDDDGAAGAETTVVPPAAAPAPVLAWSVDEDETVPVVGQSWASVWGRAGAMVAIAAAAAVVIGILGWVAVRQDGPAPSIPSTMPAAALPPITSTPEPLPASTIAAPPRIPPFSGRYAVTETTPDGRSVTNAWEVIPCGDECVKVTPVGGHVGPDAHLVDGQWVFDNTLTAFCADGTSVPSAGHGHFTIDAATLRGTLKSVWTKVSCSQPPGETTHSLELTKINP